MTNFKVEFLKDDQGDGVASAIVKPNGTRIELLRPDWLGIQVPKHLCSGFAPDLERPFAVQSSEFQPSTTEQATESWMPIISSLVFGEIVRRFSLAGAQEYPPAGLRVAIVEIPPQAAIERAIESVQALGRIVDVIAPAMTWAVPPEISVGPIDQRVLTSTMPPTDLLPSLVERALKLDDKFEKLLALAVVLALGQEAVFLAEGFGEIDGEAWTHDIDRQKRWFQVLKQWLDFLHGRINELVPLKVVLPRIHDDSRTKWRGSWLPVTTIRAVSFQIKLNLASKWRDDFISRIGMESPWDNGPVWAVKDRPTRDIVFCDPWPCPLENVHWWQNCLLGVATKLIDAALKGQSEQAWDVYETEVPWFRQSLAATISLAHSMEQFVGRKMLTEAASAGPEICAAPNTLIADEARLINKPYVVDLGEIWKVAENPSLLADERVAAPVRNEVRDTKGNIVEEKIVYHDSGNRLMTPVRNLAECVKLGIERMEEFRRVRSEETDLLMWWRGLRQAVHHEFVDAIFGHGWAWDSAIRKEQMLFEDYPPSGRSKEGWLPWVIAMKARNQHLPPNFPVPSEAELQNIGVDSEQDEEAFDIIVTRAGTIPGQDPFQQYRKPSRLRPVRQLALQGWHGKPEALDRTLQWLAAAKPEPGKMHWFTYVTISACVVLARWIHPAGSTPKVRAKLIDVLRFKQREAAESNEDHAVAARVWVDAYLKDRQPFPV